MVAASETTKSEYLTVPAAARRLGVSAPTVKRMIAEGFVRAYRFRHKVVIRESDLEAAIEAAVLPVAMEAK